LLNTLPENVEKKAEFIYRRILHEKLLDCSTASVPPAPTVLPAVEDNPGNPYIHQVDINFINFITNEDSRSFGGEWLSKQMIDACELSDFLSQNIDNEEMAKLISVEIISRMVHPSSEMETSRWLESESSLCEIMSLNKSTDHRKLYNAANKLYAHKEKVEDFLYQYFASKYPDRMRLCM